MIDKTITELLKIAIIKAYKVSDDYFEPSYADKWPMVYRIARYFAEDLEDDHGMLVDIETTRCKGQVKKIVDSTIVRPDLIVHDIDGRGVLVVEFKCSENQTLKLRDYAKLSLFTLKNKPKHLKKCCPTYETGIFVYLGTCVDDIRVTLFENGEIIKDYEDVILHEI